jgi:hypothetical protein
VGNAQKPPYRHTLAPVICQRASRKAEAKARLLQQALSIENSCADYIKIDEVTARDITTALGLITNPDHLTVLFFAIIGKDELIIKRGFYDT